MAEIDEELAKLETQLKELKARRPEHCSGRDGFVSAHQSSRQMLERIEELEDKIKELREKAGRPSDRKPTQPK